MSPVGNKLSQIWSNRPDGAFATHFMTALRFHKEKWEWAARPEAALWWVVDDTTLNHAEMLALVQKHVQCGKPAVALPKGTASLVSLPPGWKRFDLQPRPADVFCWTHGEKKRLAPPPPKPAPAAKAPEPVRTPAPARNGAAASGMAAQPWRSGKFKLIQWPSLAKYKGDVAITTGIGRLMGMFITYAHAVEAAGIDSATLNAILAEAHANGKMQLEQAPESAAAPQQTSPSPSPTAHIVHAQPWRHGKFKLIQWPSLSKYNGDVAITTGIGRLMGMFITYAHAVETAGIDGATLNAILAEAHANGKMQVEPAPH